MRSSSRGVPTVVAFVAFLVPVLSRFAAQAQSDAQSSSLDTVAPDPEVQRPLRRTLVPEAIETRLIAILMVDFGQPLRQTADEVRRAAFDAPDSMQALYAESSFGKLVFEGDVFDGLTIPQPESCDIAAIGMLAREAALNADIDLEIYDHLLYYHPTLPCIAGGSGEMGRPASPARQTWYNNYVDAYLLTHELGHNLGMQHARGYSCGASPISPPEQCREFEYGDPADPMGVGITHFQAYFKAAQGWFENCSVVTTSLDGHYSITPLELPSEGIQALRIPMALELCPHWLFGSCFYYLEYRQPLGVFDGGPGYANNPMHEGVLIHVAADLVPDGSSIAFSPALLDATPELLPDGALTFTSARLAPGETFADPSGLRISVESASSASIKVMVDLPDHANGSAVCLDGTPFELSRCDDGERNGTETDVDCGGACAPCQTGEACRVAADCQDGLCEDGVCASPMPACDWPALLQKLKELLHSHRSHRAPVSMR